MAAWIAPLGFALLTALFVVQHLRARAGGASHVASACPRCRASVPEGRTHCPSCRAPLQAFAVVTAPHATVADPSNGPQALHAVVRADACAGCGTCVAACPEVSVDEHVQAALQSVPLELDFSPRVHEVGARVGAHLHQRSLRPREHHRLVEARQQKREGARGVGHRVGAVQDDKAVIILIVRGDELGNIPPVGGQHVGRVEQRRATFAQRNDMRIIVQKRKQFAITPEVSPVMSLCTTRFKN